MDIATLNYVLSLGTIAMQIGIVALAALYSLRAIPFASSLLSLLHEWVLVKVAALATVASILTLYYSEVLGVIPCGLCWMERVFMYPLAVMFIVAALRRDYSLGLYGIILSAIGAAISLYHHVLQMSGNSLLPCPASGAGDCAKRIIFEFGYITFPLMAFTVFTLIAVLLFLQRRLEK